MRAIFSTAVYRLLYDTERDLLVIAKFLVRFKGSSKSISCLAVLSLLLMYYGLNK